MLKELLERKTREGTGEKRKYMGEERTSRKEQEKREGKGREKKQENDRIKDMS